MMRYYFLIILSLLLFNGCDDGDLITSEVNLDNETNVQKCDDSNTLYKINGSEVIILNVSESNFINQVTPEGSPRVVSIGNEATAVFRKYSGVIDSKNICTNPAPANPVVLEEWGITGGTIEIITKSILDNSSPAAIVAFNHNIILKNVTFTSPSNEKVVYTEKIFGNYRTEVTKLPFKFEGTTIQKCDSKKLLFKYDNSEVLILELDPKLFEKSATPKGKPREVLINSLTNGIRNKVTYRTYNGSLNKEFFCATLTPSIPTLVEEWPAEDGEDGISGIVRVESEAANTTASVFKFTIILYKVIYKNGFREFTPTPDEYIFGSFEE